MYSGARASLFQAVKKVWAANVAATNRNTSHCIVEDGYFKVVIIPKTEKCYKDLGMRSKQRVKLGIKGCIEGFNMSSSDILDVVTSSTFFKREELQREISNPLSKTQIQLSKCGVPRVLSSMHSVALLLTREYTERDAEFIRRYFGALPPVKKLRSARQKLLCRMPQIEVLDKTTNKWSILTETIGTSTSEISWNILCSRFNLREALEKYLFSSIENEALPGCINLRSIENEMNQDFLVLQLSIDTGGGTTKMMGRLVHSESTQSTKDVILLGEAHAISETWSDLYKVFGKYQLELSSILKEGLTVNGKNF